MTSNRALAERIGPLGVLLCVAIAIGVPASQALTGWGIPQDQFAAQGDKTLRVAGYAFSIWGLLYAGLLAYAVRRVAQGAGGAVEAAVDAPLAAASLGCGLWIVAAGLNLMWLTVPIIFASLAAALIGMARLRHVRPKMGWPDRVTLVWPISGLAGWLTAASILNLLTVLTAKGLIAPSPVVAIAGIAVAGLIAAVVLWSTRLPVYAYPVSWGLIGAFVAERADKPAVAGGALVCALLLLGAAVFVTSRNPRH